MGRVRGSALAAPQSLSFEIKNRSGEAVAALPGCVWEVCDLTSMRKRLELRDRKNKQLSPSPEKRLVHREQSSMVGNCSRPPPRCSGLCIVLSARGVRRKKIVMRRLLEVSKQWAKLSLGEPARTGHRLGGWRKAKPFSAAVTQ